MFWDVYLPLICIFGMVIVAVGHMVWLMISPYVRGIHIGRTDINGWSKEDYRDWYITLGQELRPLTRRELRIMRIVTGYYLYGHRVL